MFFIQLSVFIWEEKKDKEKKTTANALCDLQNVICAFGCAEREYLCPYTVNEPHTHTHNPKGISLSFGVHIRITNS